jgi:hypothetical protein
MKDVGYASLDREIMQRRKRACFASQDGCEIMQEKEKATTTFSFYKYQYKNIPSSQVLLALSIRPELRNPLFLLRTKDKQNLPEDHPTLFLAQSRYQDHRLPHHKCNHKYCIHIS